MSDSLLQIGTIVSINPESQYYFQLGTQYADGTVGYIDDAPTYRPQYLGTSWYHVRFENGYENCYKLEDLIVISEAETKLQFICKDCNIELTQVEDMFECIKCGSIYTNRMEQLRNVI